MSAIIYNGAVKSENELKRHIGLVDIFFMSFGGQAPYLSLLTYGTAAMLIALFFSPIVILLGGLVVLVNGLSIYFLSKKHDEEGGYFNYAFKSLSHRFGFETGWLYLFYSMLYGAGYIIGSVFVLTYVFPQIPSIVAFAIVIIPSSSFLLLGIKPSARYAVFAGSLEMIVLVAIVIAGLYGAHFHFYNPVVDIPSPAVIVLGILFALGIPTGYGAVTPVSGEVKNAKKNVGKATIMVILTGVILASLVVYSLTDYGVSKGNFMALVDTKIPVITIMSQILGPVTTPLLLFAAINDGILGGLAFLTAFSRTLYSMSFRGLISKKFEHVHLKTNTPVFAGLVTIIITLVILIPSLFLVSNTFVLFEALGSIAGLSNLLIHSSSNFALLKENLRRATRKIKEFGVSTLGIIVSGAVFVYSIITSAEYIELLVTGMIIVGFLLVEVMKIKDEDEIEKRNTAINKPGIKN